jgi:hypothetical protein
MKAASGKRNHCRSHMHRRNFRKSGSRLGSGHASENTLLHVTPDSKGSSVLPLPVLLGEMRWALPTVQHSSTMYVQTCSTWH